MTPLTAMEITKPGGAGRAIITLRDPGNNKSVPQISTGFFYLSVISLYVKHIIFSGYKSIDLTKMVLR